MFKFLRKHQWILIAALAITCVSLLVWMNPSSQSGGGGTGNHGYIDGKEITQQAFKEAANDVGLLYWLHYGQWPGRNPNISQKDLQVQIYERLMLLQEGEKLGIHVGADAVATAAKGILSSPRLLQQLGANGHTVPLNDFVRAVLQPQGMTAGDFENFVRHDLIIDQVRQVMGMTGELITPHEAAAVYRREYQEREAQIVFFSASNYLASVPVTTSAVDQFYTNYMAEYRLPDRVSVSYVGFSVTNFMTQAEHELSTNLNDQVNTLYDRYGTNVAPDAKTPAEAKAKIREILIRQKALEDAHEKANAFATQVFNMEPVKPQNLATVAKQKGLTVHVTAPFGKQYGPEEFIAPAEFTKQAFQLSQGEPLAGPIIGRDAVYVIALDKQLPSEIPALSKIRPRVARDYQVHEATLRAQAAGTNFANKVSTALAAGKSFSDVCSAAGVKPDALPPFSLHTQDLPALENRAPLRQVQSATFTTEVHHASGFEQTEDGGFIVYVKMQLPLDVAEMNANLPQFTASLRQQRQNAAFYDWMERTANETLGQTPLATEQSSQQSSSNAGQ